MKKILAVLLCVTLFVSIAVTAAADFTPSVTAKQAPEAINAVDSTGASVEVSVTAVADKDELDASSKEVLTKAYDTILSAKSISDITDADKLAEVMEEIAPDVDVKDMVVRDLLSIDVSKASGKISITLETNVDPDTPVVALTSVDGEEWDVLSSDSVEVNSDGSVTVTISGSCTIALAVPSSK